MTRQIHQQMQLHVEGDKALLSNLLTGEIVEFTQPDTQTLSLLFAGEEVQLPESLSHKLDKIGAFVSATMPTKEENLLECEVGEELVVYNLKDNSAHCLSGKSIDIFRKCDGQSDMSEIARSLDSTGPDGEEVLQLALSSFRSSGLIKQSYAASRKFDRRSMLKAAAAIPLVTSIMVPKPAAAVSCGSTICDIIGSGDCGMVCRNLNDNTCTWICTDLRLSAGMMQQRGQSCNDPTGNPFNAVPSCGGLEQTCCVPAGASSNPCGTGVNAFWCCSAMQSGGLCS